MSDSANIDQDWSPEHEKDVVTRAQSGDSAAMEELLAQHQDIVYRTALKFMSGDEDEATELAQEVLIRAYRKIDQFRTDSKFSTWLYRITANLAKNRFVVKNRERKRFFSMESQKDEDSRPREWKDEGISPRTAAHGKEQMEMFYAALDKLEQEWKEIIILRYVEDLSYTDIADALEIALGTVKSRINRARRALKDAMTELSES